MVPRKQKPEKQDLKNIRKQQQPPKQGVEQKGKVDRGRESGKDEPDQTLPHDFDPTNQFPYHGDVKQKQGRENAQKAAIRSEKDRGGGGGGQGTVSHSSQVEEIRGRTGSSMQNCLEEQQEGLMRAEQFDWDLYLAVRAGQPSLNGHLCQHQDFVERTLGEHIFRPKRLVQVHHQLEGGLGRQLLKGRVGVTIGDEVFVEVNSLEEWSKAAGKGEADSKQKQQKREEEGGARVPPYRAFFALDQVELVHEKQPKFEGYEMLSGEEWECIDSAYRHILAECRPWLSRPLGSFIEKGMFFELHDPEDIFQVHLVQVLGRGGGMILAGRGDGRKEWVHIGSERCHPLGWATRQNAKFCDDSSRKYTLAEGGRPGAGWDEAQGKALPWWLFTFRPLQSHHFEPGMLLEMLDPGNSLAFLPAFVSQVLNRHFFKVCPIRDVRTPDCLDDNPEQYLCHRNSPELLPLGWCFKNQIRLALPHGLNSSSSTSDSSYLLLRQRLQQHLQQKAVPMPTDEKAIGPPSTPALEFTFAPNSLFDLPKMLQKRLECVRYCEVQDRRSPSLFYPAAIIRSHCHLLWVHFACKPGRGRHSLPRVYSTSSLELFRAGSAAEAFPRRSQIYAEPIRIPPQLAEERQRLVQKYNSSRRTSSLLSDGEQAFLPQMWLQGDLWLPAVHLNVGCFPGPFLLDKRLAALCRHFGPGPVPHMVKELFRAIILCANRPQELATMLGLNSDAEKESSEAQKMTLKIRHSKRTWVSVEVCESAAQFPGWLAMLLIRLDACPNLFSLEPLDECPLKCSDSHASLVCLSAGAHSQTVSGTSSQWLVSKFQQDVKQQNRELAANRQRLAQLGEGGGEEGEPTALKKRGRKKKRELPQQLAIWKMRTRATTAAAAAAASTKKSGRKVQEKEGEEEEVGRKRSKLDQLADPEGEASQESQCSTATTASSSSARTALSSASAESGRTAPSSSSSIEPERISPGQSHSVRDADANLVQFKTFLGAVRSGVPGSVLAKKTVQPKTRTATRPHQHQQLPPVPGSNHSAAGSLLDKRVGMVSPYNVQLQQEPSQLQQQLWQHSMVQQVAASSSSSAGFPGHFNAQQLPVPLAPSLPGAVPHSHSSHNLFLFVPPGHGQQQQMGGAVPMPSSSSSSSSPSIASMGGGQPHFQFQYPPVQADPAQWSCEELAQWVTRAGHKEVAKRMKAEEVDGFSLLLFTCETFQRHLGLKVGPAVKMSHMVQNLRLASNHFNSFGPGQVSGHGQKRHSQ